MTDTAVTPLSRPSLRGRYRSWYQTLPPALQMIGLQLWLPIFFVIAFVFCYLFAFHAPAFHHIPVAVVGQSQVAEPTAAGIRTSAGDTVDISTISTLEQARTAVRDGSIAAAYAPDPSNGRATIVVASAANYQLSTFAQQFFGSVATASKATVTIDDLAPLPKADAFGTSLFYLTLLCTIAGYMVAMFVGMMGGGLRHWQRFTVIAAGSVILPLVAVVLVRFVVHAVYGHFWMLWLVGAATSFAVGCVVNGLAYFLGRFVTGAALLVFVFANVPASGGAYAAELLPQPFQFLHDFVTGTATVDLFRRTVYGVGPASWQGWLLLGCYAAAGVLLALVGRPYFIAKARRHRRAGKRSMMASAQIASLTHAGYVTPVDDWTTISRDANTLTHTADTKASQTHGGGGESLVQQEMRPHTPHQGLPIAAPGVGNGLLITATASAESGPLEVTVHVSGDPHAHEDRRTHRRHRHPAHRQRDDSSDPDHTAEEADGDAVAAETGVLG